MFPSFAILLLSAGYVLGTFSLSLLVVLTLINAIIFIPSFLQWKNKKMFITKNKIYVYIGKDKIIGWNLLEEVKTITVNQSKYGKILNYGTLTLINQNEQSYDFEFLNDPKQMFEKIIAQHEYIIKKINLHVLSEEKPSTNIIKSPENLGIENTKPLQNGTKTAGLTG